MNLINFLKKQKEGAFVGGTLGLLFYFEYQYDLVKRLVEILGLATDKAWLTITTLIVIGVLVGGLMDSLYKKNQ